MERPKVDVRKLVEEIQARAAREPALSSVLPAERFSGIPSADIDQSQLALGMPKFRQTFDLPRGGSRAKLKNRIKVLVGKAVFAVLHRYLQDEEEFLTKLSREHTKMLEQIDDMAVEVADSLAEVRGISERLSKFENEAHPNRKISRE